MDVWTLRWVFPVAVGFSTIVIGSGASGALLFSPFFLLVLAGCWSSYVASRR
jgi:hypothetical protein